jgi:hypothetical protein
VPKGFRWAGVNWTHLEPRRRFEGRKSRWPERNRATVGQQPRDCGPGDNATLGQAAAVAGLSQTGFLRELGKRRIPVHYGADDLAEDLKTVDALAPR